MTRHRDTAIDGTAAAALAETLGRIDRFDDEIGAFVDVLRDDAERDAADFDRRADVRPTGIAGTPIGVKELFDVRNGDNSYGSEIRSGLRADADAVVVRRLRAAGAIVVGLTRSHEFGWGITTQHATRGSTSNPWDLGRVPGGSSGGSAAAVAAGMVALAVGSDTGGSIRIPAAFCGVLGLKTTPGCIPRGGGVALAPTFDTPGFLARTVGLLAAALAAVAGPDASDPTTFDVAPADDAPSAGSLRFAAPPELHPFDPSPARAAALSSVMSAIEDLGGRRIDVNVPTANDMFDLFVPHQMAEAHYVHSTVLGTWPDRSDSYGSDVRARLRAAERVETDEYVGAVLEARAARGRYLAAFDEVDVLVSLVGSTGPSTTTTPDEVVLDGRAISLREAVMPTTVPQNIAGLPSLTVPVGLDEDGMPIGVQLTGPPWSEQRLLRLGESLERAELFVVRTPERFATE